MASIIDGLEKTTRRETIELLATIETYTLWVRLTVFIKRIRNLLLKIFRKNFTPAGMQLQFEQTKSELAQLSSPDLYERLCDDLRRQIKIVLPFSKLRTKDQLSVSLLRTVSSLYGRKNFTLMSPAEMADDLKVKCEKRKSTAITHLPGIWLWSSGLLALCTIGAAIYFRNTFDWRITITMGVLGELVWCFLCRCKSALEKLARAIALSGKSYQGSFSPQVDALSLREWSAEDIENFEHGLRTLHTLQSKIRKFHATKDELHRLNEQSEQLYQNNLQSVDKLRIKTPENSMEREEQARKIRGYLEENSRIERETKQRGETITTINEQISHTEELFNRLLPMLTEKIRKLWETRYRHFVFDDEFFENLICYFEWFSFEAIERRLLELERADDPCAVGKKHKNCFLFEFAIEGKACALVYAAQDSLRILAVQRDFLPSDVGMLDQQVEDALIEYGLIEAQSSKDRAETEALLSEMSERIRHGEETIVDLNNQVVSLSLDKKTAELEMRVLEQQKESLYSQLRQLQSVIAQGNPPNIEGLKLKEKVLKNQIARLQEALAEKTAEIESLQNRFEHQYNDACEQLKNQKEYIQRLRNTLSESSAEKIRLQTEYDTLQKDMEDMTNQRNFSKSSLQQIEKALAQQKRENSEQRKSYETLKSSMASIERTITKQQQEMCKIEADRDALENAVAAMQKELKVAEVQVAKQEKNIGQLKKSLAEQQAQLDCGEIIEDHDIREELERAFCNASTEIDIISPWVGGFTQKQEFCDLIENALRRGVTVKIKYGFRDHRNRPDFNREDFQKIQTSKRDLQKDEKSLLYIHRLHKQFDHQYPGKLISYRQDSHAKLLIVDRSYYLIGSYNFLSYDGQTVGRGEISLRDENSFILNKLYSRYFLFDENHPSWIAE